MSLLRDLLEARSAHVVDVESGADGAARVLVRTDDSGTLQLAEYADGRLRPLTALPEPVTGRYLPGRRAAVIAVDSGGNEQHQLYVLPLDRDEPVTSVDQLRPLAVDPAVKHVLGGVSHDGRLVTYSSTERNGVDLDVWVRDVDTGEARMVYGDGGYCEPYGFSPDGRWVGFSLPGRRPLDNEVLLVDLTTGERRNALPHDEAAIVTAPLWLDARTFYVSSNAGRDLQALWRCEVDGAEPKVVLERDWDVEAAVSGDGSTLLLLTNVDGSSRCELLAADTLQPLGEIGLPEQGVVGFSHLVEPPVVSGDGRFVGYTFSSPRQPATAYVHDRGSGTSTLVAGEPHPVDPARLSVARLHRVESFDGEPIPLFLFPPTRGGGREGEAVPAVLVIHGGPEGQSMLVFNPIVQGLADAGYAVVVPNVRGSTGYGKRYYGLDDTTRRLDSVRDLAAIHAWLPSAGVDPARAALWGGSYGGYMVLAGVAFQPELWAAGVDIVGISDLVTFLENTSAYRRAMREREYGTLEHDREFLASASPLRRVDQIRAPLFVIHGANDPRVPLSEARQLVASLAERGVETELLVYGDEGHGLGKLVNRLDAYPRALAFLDRVLRPIPDGT